MRPKIIKKHLIVYFLLKNLSNQCLVRLAKLECPSVVSLSVVLFYGWSLKDGHLLVQLKSGT